MELLEKTMFPLQTRLSSFSSRFRFRKPGMLNLHQDVEACEYQDVQIMWEMLKRAETEMGRSPSRPKNKPIWNNIFRWIRISPCSSSSRHTTTTST